MQGRYDFDVLKNELLEKLEARGCSSITITGYGCKRQIPRLN